MTQSDKDGAFPDPVYGTPEYGMRNYSVPIYYRNTTNTIIVRSDLGMGTPISFSLFCYFTTNDTNISKLNVHYFVYAHRINKMDKLVVIQTCVTLLLLCRSLRYDRHCVVTLLRSQ